MDAFHPTLGFAGEAFDTLDGIIARMRGYGVTLTFPDGSEAEAVLLGSVYSEADDQMHVRFYRVTDDVWPVAEDVPAHKVETAFVSHIQVS